MKREVKKLMGALKGYRQHASGETSKGSGYRKQIASDLRGLRKMRGSKQVRQQLKRAYE